MIKAAVNTCKAKWWELWLVGLFGKRRVECAGSYCAEFRFWRGKYYFWKELTEEVVPRNE